MKNGQKDFYLFPSSHKIVDIVPQDEEFKEWLVLDLLAQCIPPSQKHAFNKPLTTGEK